MTKTMLVVMAVLAGLVATCLPAPAASGTAGSMIAFGRRGAYKGYFVPVSGGAKRPGIVMIHEWWGLNDNIKAEADR